MTDAIELNLDGLVGPSHHYAGLSEGNLASTNHALQMANPQAAARQGLSKMRRLHELGIPQAVMPPHFRPNLDLLRRLGFEGNDVQVLDKAKKQAPALLSAAYSASGMWTANAATITPSADSADQQLHFTAANLVSNLHRHHEAGFTYQLLKTIFPDERYFKHHDPLPFSLITSDEGAANHNRFCQQYGRRGIHLFVYGKSALNASKTATEQTRFPARQTLEASNAIARCHQLDEAITLYARQNPAVIDQGVFHNDVISVANESVFLVHEEAFVDQKPLLRRLQEKANFELEIIEIPSEQLSVKAAVGTYLFNSQLIRLPDQSMCLIAPIECQENAEVRSLIEEIIEAPSNPIRSTEFVDLRQSMQNGGGPACLRLRIVMTKAERAAMHSGVLLDEALFDTLDRWIIKHYRTELHADDLADPRLIPEIYDALDELSHILKLGSIYPFQR